MFFKKPHLLFSLQKYLLSNATHLMFGWVVRWKEKAVRKKGQIRITTSSPLS